MPHLWTRDDAGAWTPLPADAAPLDIRPAGDAWVLFGAAAVRVNGVPLVAGIAVLTDRDEIVAGGRRVFFSAEADATVAPFAGPAPLRCPRCTRDVEPGTPAVVCPGCRIVHHQSAERPCYTYSRRCAACDHGTTLDAGPSWCPEAL